MTAQLYELVTGRPWTMGRSTRTDGIVLLGKRFANELSQYDDQALIRDGDRIVTSLLNRVGQS